MNACLLPPLTANASLGELLLYDAQVHPQMIGRTVASQFDQRPALPGVIVVEDSKVLGVISRRNFHHHLSHPYGQEIHLQRAVSIFLEIHPKSTLVLQLPESTRIENAVQQGLQRLGEQVFEPIVVTFESQLLPKFRYHFLLDFQVLLLAQSKILSALNTEARAQQKQLEREQQKVRNYMALLQQQQSHIYHRNQLLEAQKQEMVKQSQNIEHLNRRFFHMGQLLAVEGKKAFQATFAGVNAICQNTNQVVDTGALLNTELEAIHATSQLIQQVSRQVRHLSVQAGILAHQSGIELNGFSHIATEISQLTVQTADAGRRLDLLANRFEERLAALMQSAQGGTVVARSLITEIEQAGIALNELEKLVQHNGDIHLPPAVPVSDVISLESARQMLKLLKKLSSAEETLSDLFQLVDQRREPEEVQGRSQTCQHYQISARPVCTLMQPDRVCKGNPST